MPPNPNAPLYPGETIAEAAANGQLQQRPSTLTGAMANGQVSPYWGTDVAGQGGSGAGQANNPWYEQGNPYGYAARTGNSYLNTLLQGGYNPYTPGQAPPLNMGAYGPIAAAQGQAAQIDPQFLAALQQQMNGQGAANQALQASALNQLRTGTQANIAAQAAMAAGQRGNQNPGAAAYELAQGAANANQQAAGQAANTLAQQQAALSGNATSALGQLSGEQANLQEQTALENQRAANQIGLANQSNAQAGNAAQQGQYQFGQNLQAQSQTALNNAIAGMAGAGQQQGYQQTNAGIAGALQAVGGGLAAAAPYASLAGTGGVFDRPTQLTVGERGPEAIVPLDGSQGDPHTFLEAMHQRYLAGQRGIAEPHVKASPFEEMLRKGDLG